MKRFLWGIWLLFLFQGLGQAEIYKWVDERGQTHYAEEPPEAVAAEEISERLKENENYIKFKEVGDIQFYIPPPRVKATNVKIDIQLVKYQLAPATRKIIQRQVKNIYQAYVEWFGWEPQPARAITIKIFGDYNDFEKYQIDKKNGHVTSRSHYSPARKEVVMLGTEFTSATLNVLYHEASHAILDMEMRSSAKWINEGLAETFEFIVSQNGRVGVRSNKAWVEINKQKLNEGSLLHIREYLAISNQQWRSSPAQVERTYYIVAWSMMRFMVSSGEGVEALKKIMQASKRTPWWQKGRLIKLFAANYPGGINKLDSDWRKWIRSAR